MTLNTSFPTSLFSSNIPDLSLTTSATRVEVKIYFVPASVVDSIDDLDDFDDLANYSIYDEYLYPDSSKAVEVCELDALINPFALQALKGYLRIAVTEDSATTNIDTTVYYCSARVEESASNFADTHFLSRLDGKRLTSMGRLEYLHYFGSDTPTATAYYTDGTNATFTPETIGGGSSPQSGGTEGGFYYKTIDVSPSNFATTDKTLAYYIVTAGSRSQEFEIDFNNPDCAPILAFTNCFGVQELAYCTGTLESSPEVKYTQNYIKGKMKTQTITQVRTLKADTGVLTFPMADWLQDLFTSQEIYLVEMVNGYPNVSEDQIAITDCKQDYTNDRDSLPRFTFEYRRATRNTSVIPYHREGRIFDTSFDFTFN